MTDSIDLPSATVVEIHIDSSGKLWVNINGNCALRISHVERLVIDQMGTDFADRNYITQDYGRVHPFFTKQFGT